MGRRDALPSGTRDHETRDADIRAEATRALADLNDSTKAQQAFLNSCFDVTWIGEDDRRSIRWLLTALVEHRRRVRVTARIWRTLSRTEPVAGELVRETADLLDENRYFAPLIAQWRSVMVGRTHMERHLFWRSVLELAERNLDDRYPDDRYGDDPYPDDRGASSTRLAPDSAEPEFAVTVG